MDGFQLMKLAREKQPDLAVVIMTGYGTVETAVESLHQGADGMILKPFSGAELVQGVEQALRDRQREREVQRLQALRPLLTISGSLFAEKSPERLQHLLLDVLITHLQCSHVSIYQCQAESSNWEQHALQGIPLDFSRQLPKDGEESRVENLFPEQLREPVFQAQFRQYDLGFYVYLPLNFANTQQFLFAARKIGEPDFNESELETLRILGQQAIVAFENAQLYAELQERIQQVESSQQALIQAEKMAAVGRLTASIAHEINNPLHSIHNCLHLARRAEITEPDRKEYLELASEELDRLMNTVRQMLDFYRPSALDRKPIEISEIILKVIKLLEAQLTDHQVKVTKNFKPNLPPVLAVENQIQQVVFNLFLNALEAMPSGGEISITTDVEGQNIAILIADTGTGIQLESREEVFEPFFSTKEKGLGLGLTVSYGVITAHNGSLNLVPDYEAGACFKILLPAYMA
jgi:signal transduction histidine kinase